MNKIVLYAFGWTITSAQVQQQWLLDAINQNSKLQALNAQSQSFVLRSKSMLALDAPIVNAEWMNQTPFQVGGLKITAQQMLPWPGKRQVMAATEKRSAGISQAEASLARLEFAQNFVRVYSDLWLAQQLREVRQSYKTQLEFNSKIWGIASRQSAASAVDLLQMNEMLGEWQRDSLQLDLDIQSLVQELQSLRGLPQSTTIDPLELQFRPSFPPLDSTLMNWWTGPQKAQILTLEQKQKGVYAQFKPDLMVGFSYEKSAMGRDSYSLMAGMSLPMVPWAKQGREASRQVIQNDIKIAKFEMDEQKRILKLNWAQAVRQDSLQNEILKSIREISLPRLKSMEQSILTNYVQSKADLRDLREIWKSKIELEQQALNLQMQIQMNRWIWGLPSVIGAKP